MSLMRPSLKPRNLAISTGDLFCSDGVETMQEENNKRIERITKKRKKKNKQTNNICTRKKVTTERRNLCELRFRTEFGATGKRRSAQTDPS